MGDVASDRFGRFVHDFWPEARRAGISRRIYERAFRGVGPDPSVLQLAQDQPEFKTPVSDYLSKRVTPQRIAAGQGMAQTYVATLDRIERRYGVDREILLAIWGMESNFGSHKGEMSVIRSLATLAYTGSRRKFGRSQLIAALRILQRGDIDADGFTGSWAGAMGHTQFIPTTYNAYAVDWTGDGRRDIWNSIEDALASTANYLAHSGWQRGLKWGYEVQLPARSRPAADRRAGPAQPRGMGAARRQAGEWPRVRGERCWRLSGAAGGKRRTGVPGDPQLQGHLEIQCGGVLCAGGRASRRPDRRRRRAHRIMAAAISGRSDGSIGRQVRQSALGSRPWAAHFPHCLLPNAY